MTTATQTTKPAGRPRKTGFTHTGYLVSDSENFTYAVVLTEMARFWQDSKGFRYSKRTGEPIGRQPFPSVNATLRAIEPAIGGAL